jgi:phage terminase large subunit-like protein
VAKRTPGPKIKSDAELDLSKLSPDFPQRAFDLLAIFGYKPYRWQRRLIAKIYRNRAKALPLYYVQIAKKNGKTAVAVMITLIEVCLFNDRECYAVSDSERNVKSVYWLELLKAIRFADLEDWFSVYQGKITNPDTDSFIELRPGNFAASQGINSHLVIADEVHLIDTEVWNGYLMSGDARDDAVVLGITTPGYSFDCAAFDLYNAAKEGDDPDMDATIYEPSDLECAMDDEQAWAEANPAMDEVPSLKRALKRHCRRMRENDFRRFRLGQWTQTEKAWLPYGAFRALATDEPIPVGARVWLAVDGSWSGDTTALLACDETCKLQVLGHWKPPVMDVDDLWRVPMADVEQAIRIACGTYEVEGVYWDPARWSRNMQALAAEGLPILEYPQSVQRMIPATTMFFDAVMDGKLSWVNDEKGKALAAHVAAAEVRESKDGAMIQKPTFVEAKANIDCAVAALMAHDRAVRAGVRLDWSVEWIDMQEPA